jgi:hypothetical protein
MAQVKSNTLAEVRTPFTNMSFTPDVPATVLNPLEYNSGFNVETDIRGIRSVLGDEAIWNTVPGTPIYITGGYRANNVWWFIVATSDGNWWRQDQTLSDWVNCAPGGVPLSGYSLDTNITEAWSGTTLFINDDLNPPMFLIGTGEQFTQYSDDPAAASYVWNYYAGWTSLTAGFVRLYNTPNVGSILIAGNLTAVNTSGFVENYPTTVRWSQAFGLNDAPLTWAPTTQNVANELEVPVRGPVLDGFPSGGNFFVCSYWDTVVFSPISYQGTNNPVLGMRLFTQGRGLLNANCWANADHEVYGLDARDFWVFDGSEFSGLGTQRVRNYFFDNLNPVYADRVFLENNTKKSQIEVYYPDLNSTGWCNQMLSYNYLLKVWNPPRQVSNASMATEAPVYLDLGDSTSDFDAASRTIVYSRGVANSQIVQKDQGHVFLGNTAISTEFRRDNIHLTDQYSNQLLVHRILPEATNLNEVGLPVSGNSTGNITVAIGGSNSVGQAPTFKANVTMQLNTDNPWCQIDQNVFRINSIKITNVSSTDAWICPGITWQFTPTQDAR